MATPPPPIPVAKPKKADALPAGGYAYEPKLDGWRAVVHVPAGVVHTASGADITWRVPEILDAARQLGGGLVLDGELVTYRDERIDFSPLMWGRARRRREGVAAYFVAFDLLAARGRDLREQPYERRRDRLAAAVAGGAGLVQLMESTTDLETGQGWISEECATYGIEGAVAKPLRSRYVRGERCGWVKVKQYDTEDAVVLGVTGPVDHPAALVLGQADDAGVVRVVGLSTVLPTRIKTVLAGRLRPAGPRQKAPGILGGLPGAHDAFEFQPVEPGIVVEVLADAAREWGRFRHRPRLLRVKPSG
ncbi:ATP-dependent DNA ligase [Amycolatopsis thermophila]|uniref:ATP-dependent DNA ligase n=1 Tax=Amycolatopsis thermophila TaxID=206084 RepID=A0ABU0EMW0_9PSEU|nr:hypothetical protein [Amycolatopsis thermophila]MDQ0376616.1 ATP-dependent DNA ligase [Amycolatopsis thermophila]